MSYSWRNSHWSPFLHSPLSQCLHTTVFSPLMWRNGHIPPATYATLLLFILSVLSHWNKTSAASGGLQAEQHGLWRQWSSRLISTDQEMRTALNWYFNNLNKNKVYFVSQCLLENTVTLTLPTNRIKTDYDQQSALPDRNDVLWWYWAVKSFWVSRFDKTTFRPFIMWELLYYLDASKLI